MKENTNNLTPNALISESSPYLKQHAYNPVQWLPWSNFALQRAKTEDKPIIVSIGYSTCHWCHVMERESFEDKDTADYMNEHYICIKIDREERPDLDQIYMDACQIMTGSGGWPLNCFLNTDALPFYAGTYFPPQAHYERPSWMEVLRNLHNAWNNQRDTVEAQAQKLLGYIREGENTMLNKARARVKDELTDTKLYGERPFHQGLTETIFYGLRERFDRQDGGFGVAPKFPSLMAIQYLLEYAHLRNNDEALLHAVYSLERLATGGIYDQLAGGLARYSTDNEWLAPHFEKMLYDNALFINALAQAVRMIESNTVHRAKNLEHFQGAISLFKKTIRDTYFFCLRQMSTSVHSAWYSAIDADSEGVEGKYYVWSKQEIIDLIGLESAQFFCAYFDVTDSGNWEHTNILRRILTDTAFAAENAGGEAWVRENLPKAIQILLAHRETRIAPGLDDKILLGWNALMVSATVQAYRALGEAEMLDQAKRVMDFLLTTFTAPDGNSLLHTCHETRGKKLEVRTDEPLTPHLLPLASISAFLDDYAFTIAALLDLYEVTGSANYLVKAQSLGEVVLKNFPKDDTMFYYTSSQQNDVIVRKTDLYDNALPSGNSIMAQNLLRIGYIQADEGMLAHGRRMLLQVKPLVEQYPLSFQIWAVTMQREAHGWLEIAVTGAAAAQNGKILSKAYIPNSVMAIETEVLASSSLLNDRVGQSESLVYICTDMVCGMPQAEVSAALHTIYENLT
jgi:uncharacterized protein